MLRLPHSGDGPIPTATPGEPAIRASDRSAFIRTTAGGGGDLGSAIEMT